MGVPVVTAAQEFVRHLLPGDILLFDKLSSLNRLVQWGDNRPVGHCAVWHDGSVFEATLKTLPSGQTRGGVFATPFEELLDLKVGDSRGDVGLVRTVTAMRHRRIGDQHRSDIATYLTSRDSSAEFGVKEMAFLTPFAIERSFVGSRDRLAGLIAGAIRTFQRVATRSGSEAGGPQRLFCSELAYRSYQSASLEIDIVDPLFVRFQNLRRRRPAAASPDEAPRIPGPYGALSLPGVQVPPNSVDALLAEYSDFFEREVLSDPAGDRPDSPLGRPTRVRYAEFADMITPGDFWSSPDFDPVSVFHRPPGS